MVLDRLIHVPYIDQYHYVRSRIKRELEHEICPLWLFFAWLMRELSVRLSMIVESNAPQILALISLVTTATALAIGGFFLLEGFTLSKPSAGTETFDGVIQSSIVSYLIM